jgi:Protein of unknown function DUF104/Protein of unknown function (DUF3696)
MSETIPAVYDSGVFRPLKPVDLADGTRAEVTPLSEQVRSSVDANGGLTAWPAGYFDQTAGVLAGENFERPPQGQLPERDIW